MMKKLLTLLLVCFSLAGLAQSSVVNSLQVKGLSGTPSGSTPGSNWGLIWGDGTGVMKKGSLQAVIGSRIRSVTTPNDSTITIGTDSATFSLKIRGGLTLVRQGYLDSLRAGLILDSVAFRNKGAGKTVVYLSSTRDTMYAKNMKDSSVAWVTGPDSALRAYVVSSGVGAGQYGDATHIPVITVGVDGRVSAISLVTVSGAGGGNAPKKVVNPQNSNYTLVQADTAAYITVNSAIQDTIKIPDDGTVAMAPPATIDVYQLGSGKVLFQALNGSVTIGAKFGRVKSAGQYSKVILNKIGANNWILSGDLDTTAVPFLQSSMSSLSAFSTTSGTPSTAQTFTVTGAFLSANATVTAPSGFEVSLDNTTYASTRTLTASGGILSGQPVTVYARIPASASAGNPAGSVTITSTGAATVNVSVSGTVTGGGGTAHYRAITLPIATTADRTNFPIKFEGTYSYLATVANGGKVQNASGFDITFSTDNAGSSLLNYEIEKWNPVTGQITVWIRIPTLTHAPATTIYLRYGSTSITTFQGGAAGTVWNSGYQRVWHMNQTLTASSQAITDYTSNGGNMTSQGSWAAGQQVAGQAGGALQLLHASGSYATYTSITETSTYTIEGWFNPTNATPDGDTYSFAGTSSNDNLAWGDAPGYVGLFTNNSSNKVQSGGFATPTPGTPWASNAWHHVVITRNGTAWIMYIDGVQNATSAQGTNLTINSLGFAFGAVTNDIICDELRISNVVLSADWVTDEYANLSNPSWYSVGTEN